LPPEELAKFLAAGGDKQGAERAAAQNAGGLGADNIGHKLLQKMGWKEGEGLGGTGGGRTEPVAAVGGPGGAAVAPGAAGAGSSGGLGLGAAPHAAAEEGDDEFTLYRKRMQTAYKYRPNPLGERLVSDWEGVWV
jgi:splicing factor 4